MSNDEPLSSRHKVTGILIPTIFTLEVIEVKGRQKL